MCLFGSCVCSCCRSFVCVLVLLLCLACVRGLRVCYCACLLVLLFVCLFDRFWFVCLFVCMVGCDCLLCAWLSVCVLFVCIVCLCGRRCALFVLSIGYVSLFAGVVVCVITCVRVCLVFLFICFMVCLLVFVLLAGFDRVLVCVFWGVRLFVLSMLFVGPLMLIVKLCACFVSLHVCVIVDVCCAWLCLIVWFVVCLFVGVY